MHAPRAFIRRSVARRHRGRTPPQFLADGFRQVLQTLFAVTVGIVLEQSPLIQFAERLHGTGRLRVRHAKAFQNALGQFQGR